MGLDPTLNMLPPPNPLSLPAWFNPNELWSAEQPNPRANFSSTGRSEGLYLQRASFASQNGPLSSVDGCTRDSVESGITDQAGRSNTFGSDQLDKHLQSNTAPTGNWSGGPFHLQSLNERQDEYSNIDSSSMRSLGIGLDPHHHHHHHHHHLRQSVAAGAAGTATSAMHEWQQQQLNPAGLGTGNSGPLSSSSGNSSISPFQLIGFACKQEPKSEQRDQWEEDTAAATTQKNSFIVLPCDHNNNLSAMTRSNVTSASGEASVSSGSKDELDPTAAAPAGGAQPPQPAAPIKKKRNLPGNPDPDAEVIALSPRTLLATNRFVCEICNKGFQRDQNLQLHRRGHNLPWKLKQRSSKEVVRKRVYICPESNCVHNDPARALGDLTGIKKHFCRKHGEKKWKCDKCSKRYAVQSDWKAHMKTCGTREYRCDCGTLFSRRDSFITHRAFCDALAEENSRISAHRQQVVGPDQINNPMLSGGPALMVHENMGDNGMSFFQGGMASSHPMHPSALPALAGGGALFHSSTSLQQFNDPAHHLQASLPHNPRWDPSNPLGFRSSASPKLSLWVGSGPGPPPFTNNQHIQNLSDRMQQQQTQHPLLHEPAFLMQPPRGNSLSSLMDPKDFALMDANASNISSSASFSSSSATGVAGRLSALPPNPFFNTSFLGNVNDLMHNPVTDQQAGAQFNPSSSNSATRIGGGGGHVSMGGGASTPAMYAQEHLQQAAHGANAQMSATALLQKAAMMGATASNTSVFRSISGQQSMNISGQQLHQSAATDERSSPSSITTGHALHNPNLATTVHGSFSSNAMFKEQYGASTQAFAAEHSNSSPSPNHENYINGMSSLTGGAAMHVYHSTAHTGMRDNPSKNNMFSSNNLADDQRLIMNYQAFNDDHQLMHAQLAARSLSRNPGEQEGGKPTLDFLGVGGSNQGHRGNFLQREMSTIVSMGAHGGGMEFLSSSSANDPKDPLLSHHDGNSHMGSNSSDKSADSS